MDCWNYSINRILNDKGSEVNYDEESIFSEYYPEFSILPKIGKVLLKVFPNVLIIHENTELFINLKSQEEEEVANEYREELYNYMSKWWKFWCNEISLDLIDELLSNNFYAIVPIKKDKGSHFVVLRKIDGKRIIFDNKNWEYNVTDDELLELMNLENWKYILFCWDFVKKQEDL